MKLFRIHDVRINWEEEYANDPHITVDFDIIFEDGRVELFDYRNEEHRSYWQEEVFYSSPRRDDIDGDFLLSVAGERARYYVTCPLERGGFGGNRFTFNLADGSVLKDVGAWSSRCAIMNTLFASQIVTCASNTGGCAVTIDGLVRWLNEQETKPFSIWRAKFLHLDDEIIYVIGYPDGTLKNPDVHTYLEQIA
jgi:hypothetical protein